MATLDENGDEVKEKESESEEEMDADEEAKSDDGSSSDDDDDDEMANPRLEELETQLSTNPYLYDLHIELIKLLRESGELEKLRKARENMHTYHPLTEELWLNWIEDEVKLLSPEGDRSEILRLFERATKDYLSPKIWLEYCQFSIGRMGTEEGLKECREVFEKALNHVGLHVSQGNHVWEAYRELETAVLGMQPDLGSVTSKEEEAKLDQQTERITSLFKRQLQIPLLNMKQTFDEYKEWADDDGKSMKAIYDRTLLLLKKFQRFEDKLVSQETTSTLDVYNEYLDFELKQGDPARIRCLYERAIKDHCLQTELWIKYLTYLDENVKEGTVVLSVYERAIRNCGWSVEIWMRYIRAMERHHQEYNDIKGIFEQALNAGFNDAPSFLLLWTGYCDYLRRRIVWKENHEKELDAFRLSIERAMTHLFQLFGNDGDPNCTLHQFLATVEGRYCNNMTRSRELWNEIMSRGHGKQAKMWLEYLTLERAHGDSKHSRKLLQRAVKNVTDWPEAVCEAYINFEREEGTLADYDSAVAKCREHLEMVELHRVRQKKDQGWRNQGRNMKPKPPGDFQKGKKGSDFQKGKGSQKGNEFQKGKQKSNDPKKGKQDDQKKGQKRKPDDSADEPAAKAKKSEDGFKVPVSPGPKVKKEGEEPAADETTAGAKTAKPGKQVDEENEEEKVESTVFVSNLPHDITEERLHKHLEKCGEIKEIRLVEKKYFAYVEFTNAVSVAAALAMDRCPLDKRPIYISLYKRRGEKSEFRYQKGLEKNKLWVNNLTPLCSEDALRTIFEKHGELKSIRLPTNRGGARKTFAYVEYVREDDAASAIVKTDGLTIGDMEIEVALSNPPTRKAPHSSVEEKTKEFTPTLGAGKKDTGGRGARTTLAFTPRALKKPVAAATSATKPPKTGDESVADEKSDAKDAVAMETSDDQGAGGKEAPKMKSNADFRALLLKK